MSACSRDLRQASKVSCSADPPVSKPQTTNGLFLAPMWPFISKYPHIIVLVVLVYFGTVGGLESGASHAETTIMLIMISGKRLISGLCGAVIRISEPFFRESLQALYNPHHAD